MGCRSLFIAASAGVALFASTAKAEETTISIEGYFTEALVETISEEITKIRSKDPRQKILLEFKNIEGGAIEAGFDLAETIYNAGNIDLVCRGNLQSMGATVFVSYQGGERIIGKDCTNFMLHDIIVKLWSPTPGASLIRSYAAQLSKNIDQAFEVMTLGTAQAAKMSHESAKALYGTDCHLNPSDAYRLGLADSFENVQSPLPDRIENPTPHDIYAICKTQPIASYLEALPDWNKKNFGLRKQPGIAP